MKKIFSIDRLEGNLAVCISDDGEQITVPAASLPSLKAHDVFSAELEGDSLTHVTPMPEERDRRIKENKDRIRRIIEKNGSK